MDCTLTQLTFWNALPALKPYWHWEDYKAGMFRTTDKSVFDSKLQASIGVLANPEACLAAMRRVIQEWPIASMQNLHDTSINRRPWLGRACCCIACGSSDDVVRVAWWELTDDQRQVANSIADQVIQEWESTHA